MRATSYEEATSGALLYPEQRFPAAIAIVRLGLARLHGEGIITGATIFGSSVSRDALGNSDFDLLSDVDIVAVAPDEHVHHAERQLRWLCEDVRRQTAVAAELGRLSMEEAQSGRHTMLPPMLNWLECQSRTYPDMTIGQPPASMIQPANIDPLLTVDVWFSQVINNILKVSSSVDAQVAAGLSLPHVAARKSIDVLRHSNKKAVLDIPSPASLRYSKAEVAADALYVYGRSDPALWDCYEELGLIRRGFIGFLGAVAAGKVTKQAYANTLDEFAADIVPKASRVMTGMYRKYQQLAKEVLVSSCWY